MKKEIENRFKTSDHYDSVVEELKMNGFDVRMVGNGIIEFDTIAGRMNYICSEKTVMMEYYRFIQHYGSRLYKWGLDNKLENYNK